MKVHKTGSYGGESSSGISTTTSQQEGILRNQDGVLKIVF